MANKKWSELTTIERADKILKGVTWEQAEQVGVEILARCMAKRAYVNNNGEEYLLHLAESICKRADEWAHEGNNPTLLAIAKVCLTEELNL